MVSFVLCYHFYLSNGVSNYPFHNKVSIKMGDISKDISHGNCLWFNSDSSTPSFSINSAVTFNFENDKNFGLLSSENDNFTFTNLKANLQAGTISEISGPTVTAPTVNYSNGRTSANVSYMVSSSFFAGPSYLGFYGASDEYFPLINLSDQPIKTNDSTQTCYPYSVCETDKLNWPFKTFDANNTKGVICYHNKECDSFEANIPFGVKSAFYFPNKGFSVSGQGGAYSSHTENEITDLTVKSGSFVFTTDSMDIDSKTTYAAITDRGIIPIRDENVEISLDFLFNKNNPNNFNVSSGFIVFLVLIVILFIAGGAFFVFLHFRKKRRLASEGLLG